LICGSNRWQLPNLFPLSSCYPPPGCALAEKSWNTRPFSSPRPRSLRPLLYILPPFPLGIIRLSNFRKIKVKYDGRMMPRGEGMEVRRGGGRRVLV